VVWQPSGDRTVYNLDVAYGIVKDRLSKVDINLQCERSGAERQPDGSILLRYLNENYSLDIPSASVCLVSGTRQVSLRDKILLLHYFVNAKGTPPQMKQLTYRDLPGGLVYFPTFQKRTIDNLVEFFGDRPPLLIKAGAVLSAVNAYMGDASLTVTALPRVPVTIIMWRGDGELPPGGNLIFDAGITDYLESEDVTVVCETITWRLINYARSL